MPSSFPDRLVSLKGAAWKALLRHAEALAYHVAGLPMALRGMFRGRPAASLQPADYLHRHYAWRYWHLPFGPLKGLVAALWHPAIDIRTL